MERIIDLFLATWSSPSANWKKHGDTSYDFKHLTHSFVCCVLPILACLFYSPSYCIIDVCLHAQSKDPAVYACVFAILIGCLPLFARMNTNRAEFLMARDAVVSKTFTPPTQPPSLFSPISQHRRCPAPGWLLVLLMSPDAARSNLVLCYE